jgi:hypothetical protein
VGAALATTAVAALGGPLPTLAAPRRRVKPGGFASAARLREWQEALDDVGLRATASPAHHRYVEGLAERLERAGVVGVRTESIPLRRWEPTRWRLEVTHGARPGPRPVAAYIPYSGQTPPAGISSRLGPGGKVALFDVPNVPLVHAAFDTADYGNAQHPPGYNPATPYVRPWVNQLEVPTLMEAAKAGGAEAAIGVLDLPAEAANGSYFPYDGVMRDLPSLYVDREVGAELKRLALTGGAVRLTLEARVDEVTTPNVYGFIPGRSDELVILHCHHDGTNGIEDNGQEAIVAMSEFLARLGELPRTVLVLLSTGHMATGQGFGAAEFVERHRDDLVGRTAAAVTVEHLGALEWLPGGSGRFGLTGRPEDGGFFAAPFDAVIDPAREALRGASFIPDRVMRPWLPHDESPNWVAWPGDGQPFWAQAGLPSANFITGPTYLLNAGMSTADKTDFAAMRRQAIAFTELVLALGSTPLDELRRHRTECTLCREPG